MNDWRSGTHRWAIGLFMILLAAIVGVVAYRMGVAHGIALSGELPERARDGLRAYGWHPWGFGFGFFFPFLFFGFWFLALRLLFFWGGPWRRGPWHRHDRGPDDIPRRFEEWHRRAHERMSGEPMNTTPPPVPPRA
jgi:hypothetical protein